MKNCLQGNKWTFDNTFLFVGSVATTIGFGNVTPKTISGQVLCIAFAIVRNWFVGQCNTNLTFFDTQIREGDILYKFDCFHKILCKSYITASLCLVYCLVE